MADYYTIILTVAHSTGAWHRFAYR